MIVRDLGITDPGEKQKCFSIAGGTLAPVFVEILIHPHLDRTSYQNVMATCEVSQHA